MAIKPKRIEITVALVISHLGKPANPKTVNRLKIIAEEQTMTSDAGRKIFHKPHKDVFVFMIKSLFDNFYEQISYF